MEVCDARRLKDLEREKGKLKKLLAEARWDISAIKGVFWIKRQPHRRNTRRLLGWWLSSRGQNSPVVPTWDGALRMTSQTC